MNACPNYYKKFHNYIKNFSLLEYKKKNFLAYIKMVRENITLFGNDDKSCTVIDLYLNHMIFFEHKDFYNYYDIDVDKILLFKKSDNEYIIRYNDVNKMMIVPLQLKIKNFYNELNTFANNNRVMFIYNDNKEFFRECREIWNKITELIDINNPRDLLKLIQIMMTNLLLQMYTKIKALFLTIIIDMEIIKL